MNEPKAHEDIRWFWTREEARKKSEGDSYEPSNGEVVVDEDGDLVAIQAVGRRDNKP